MDNLVLTNHKNHSIDHQDKKPDQVKTPEKKTTKDKKTNNDINNKLILRVILINEYTVIFIIIRVATRDPPPPFRGGIGVVSGRVRMDRTPFKTNCPFAF